jgi:hypothetical protein
VQLSLYNDDDTRHSPKNQREAFLYYMSKLDAEMVGLVLDDEKTYQEAKKEVFVEKLSNVFLKFSKEGDTELKVWRGECSCAECNKGCSGYAFIGNCSGAHLDLIVEGNSTHIFDIFYCSAFKTEIPEVNTGMYFSMVTYPDERATFQPTNEYLITLHQCNMACDEIMKAETDVLDLETATYWVEKYASLYEEILIDIHSKFWTFEDIYSHLKNLLSFLSYSQDAQRAIVFFNKTVKNKPDEKRLIYWLLKYEHLSNEHLFDLTIKYYNEETDRSPILLDNKYNIRIDKKPFEHLIQFKKLYDSYYFNMVDKYKLNSSNKCNFV